MRELFRWPQEIAKQLAGPDGPAFIQSTRVVAADRRRVILHLGLRPWEPMAANGYPDETVGVLVTDNKAVRTFPVEPDHRTWQHRNPIGDLCLWYPEDPPELQWTWNDGLEPYLGIVSRHVQAEEYYRRTKRWPWEDAPHGQDAKPHPIRTDFMRYRAAARRRAGS